MVDFKQLIQKYKQEIKQQKKEEVLNGIHEEISFNVIDVAITRGGLLELYTQYGDAFVIPLDETGHKILYLVKEGKLLKVEAVRLMGYKRLQEIKNVEIVDTIDVPEEHTVVGVLDKFGSSYRLITDDGLRIYFSEGTVNFERLMKLEEEKGLGVMVAIIASQIKKKQGLRGEYLTVRGFYIQPIEEEEAQEELAEQQEDPNPNKLPETIEV